MMRVGDSHARTHTHRHKQRLSRFVRRAPGRFCNYLARTATQKLCSWNLLPSKNFTITSEFSYSLATRGGWAIFQAEFNPLTNAENRTGENTDEKRRLFAHIWLGCTSFPLLLLGPQTFTDVYFPFYFFSSLIGSLSEKAVFPLGNHTKFSSCPHALTRIIFLHALFP